ncbi:hypothetical protein ACMYSQ_007891 [Aspergillus niger]
MRYTLLALALVSATLALPTDLSSQKSAAVARETNFEPAGSDSFPYQRDVQDAQETTAKDFDGPFGLGLPNVCGSSIQSDDQPADKAAWKGVAFRRDLTGTKPFVKHDNQDAQEATVKDFDGPFGPGLPNKRSDWYQAICQA